MNFCCFLAHLFIWIHGARAGRVSLVSLTKFAKEGPKRCSEVPLSDCMSQPKCDLKRIMVEEEDSVKTWCIPKCRDVETDEAEMCESPWCSLHGSSCLDFNDPVFLDVPLASVELPSWRFPDHHPGGFHIPKIPCGPGVGEVTKNFINSRYEGKWEQYFSAGQRMRLHLNGHLMKLNGCSQCEVFETRSRFEPGYSARDKFKELVVSCRTDGCQKPNFLVSGPLTYWRYCHPCPPECTECKHGYGMLPWGKDTFKCYLKENVSNAPTGYDCGQPLKSTTFDGLKVHCKLRPFYIGSEPATYYSEDVAFGGEALKNIENVSAAGWGGINKLKNVPGGRLHP
eukprot:TRINITY_DN11813_c0_g1_i1.p1 TRINITY_DN11813_c0_g1~~TRINITY_DN11813_c0_g1_i1.p1  ORF type:complete len:340 (-),score=40.45 TRINITY_DN11813_c0_g1_i1:142-1161(-)